MTHFPVNNIPNNQTADTEGGFDLSDGWGDVSPNSYLSRS